MSLGTTKSSMFQTARIKLTAWYLLILMTISICFSVVIYRMTSTEVERFARMQRLRIERNLHDSRAIPVEITLDKLIPSPSVMDPELASDVRHRMQIFFLLVNGGIFIVAGGLSYFLAGKTLGPIQEMVNDKNRFVSDASHELRTPLTAMKSSLEVYLRDPNLTIDEARKVISENIEDVNKLQNLSESLLKLTQHDSVQDTNTFSQFSMKQVGESVVKKLEPIAKKKHITIKQSIADISLWGNKEKISELLIIILDNAIKYSSEGKTVDISANKSGKQLAITIADSGIGIEKKDLPHIFDRFYRADNARGKTGKGGYGLGLAIAKQIVVAHYGKIDVKSQVKKGTAVTITLPISFSRLSG